MNPREEEEESGDEGEIMLEHVQRLEEDLAKKGSEIQLIKARMMLDKSVADGKKASPVCFVRRSSVDIQPESGTGIVLRNFV